MIYLLLDQQIPPYEFDYLDKFLKEKGITLRIIGSPTKSYKILNWILGCLKVLFYTNKNDLIICWFDLQAILLYWITLITFKQRKIICINILLKDKNTWKNKILTYLYKKPLNSYNFIASVTSLEYGNYLRRKIGCNCNFYLLHDVYHHSYKNQKNISTLPNMVFCGGRNGRDWSFIIEVAKITPEITFKLAMPYSKYMLLKNNFPSNVQAYTDIPYDLFIKELCQSELLVLPLDTEAPAGLIVIFQAAANLKHIIITNTKTTREYLSNGKGTLIPNDVRIWSETIKKRISMKNENRISSEKFLNFLQSECSEINFAKCLYHMINEITNTNSNNISQSSSSA